MLKANRPVREDEYIASLLSLMEIAEMAGFKITAPEEMQNASRKN